MQTSQLQSGTKINNGLQLFNSVSNRLKLFNIDKELDSILLSFNNNNFELDSKEYESLGIISYFIGLDFYSMTEWNNLTMSNVVSRLLLNKIDYKILSKFNKILNLLKSNDIDYIRFFDNSKELMMNKIKLNITNNENKLVFNKIKKIIENILIPVNISEDIYKRFILKDNLTYHDIIVFNSLIYNDCIVSGENSKLFISLTNDENYLKLLNKASNYFELQKFALFYKESILNFYVKNIENTNNHYDDNFFKHFLTNELVNKFSVNEENQQKFIDLKNDIENYSGENYPFTERKIIPITSNNDINNEVKPLNNGMETLSENMDNPLENANEVIKQILGDFNSISNENNINFDYVNNPKELISLLKDMLNTEDLVSSFYIFLTKYNEFKNTENINLSKIDISKYLNYSNDELLLEINNELEILKNNYDKIIKDYIVEIDKNILNELLKYIKQVLNILYIGNSEDKGVIFSQINENTIFTYKHLHQLINVIENQYLKGENIIEYYNFKIFMENVCADILNLFQESQKLENYELQSKLIYTFSNILK